ncbi:MAG: acetolactate synthase [Phycisphaeraceae bacterium]|nr:acetolactate synthase [Phycisphaeraceae bacterium]
MSQAGVPMETARGYVPPTMTQFSVFLANKVGKLYDVVEGFESAGCRICAINVHEASDHAVVRLITTNAQNTRKILREDKLPYAELDVLVVELSKGRSIADLCLCLLGAEINIHFAYPLMLRPNGTPTIALAVDEPVLGGQILRRKEYRLFGECDIADPH